jgi:uncharacterized membrane protein
MPQVDFFNFFRYVLGLIATVYATVLTLQFLWGWAIWLSGNNRYTGLLRRYLVVHGLRLRFRAFWGDLAISLLLCVVFLMLWHAHQVLYEIGETLGNAR